jgi:carbon-monoxide dehydrogenase medium subunit
MEAALAKSWSPQSVKELLPDAGDLQSDLHASAEYRAHLVTVMAQRAIANAA